jgi:hypothetical protein
MTAFQSLAECLSTVMSTVVDCSGSYYSFALVHVGPVEDYSGTWLPQPDLGMSVYGIAWSKVK